MKFKMTHGMEVIAAGRVAVYAPQGDYRLYARTITPVGQGALELAFAQLRAKLAAMGLFAPERKKPLPNYPTRLALITSRQTAAVADMLKVLRRFPWIRLYVYHVPVQGEGAAPAIAAAIAHLNSPAAKGLEIDAILLSRGGGSLEDLWAFNEDVVAMAIAASRIPIVTGIGHEVDVSIADLVADFHAHTPTEAAQVITSKWRTARDAVELSGTRLRAGVRSVVQEMRQRLIGIERHPIFRRPTDRIDAMRQLLDEKQRALVVAVERRLRQNEKRLESAMAKLEQRHPRHQVRLRAMELSTAQARLNRGWQETHGRLSRRIDALAAHLQAVGPRQVLARGYSITTVKKTSRIVRSAADAPPGTAVVTQLADGTIESVTRDASQGRLFEE
jgi:exodeoxyribonuclease VII large subunit